MFHINGEEYILPKENYIYRSKKPGKDAICGIMILEGGKDTWILGLNFFPNYYTVFDQENQRIGLGVSKNAIKRIKDHKPEADVLIETNDDLRSPNLKSYNSILTWGCGCLVLSLGLSFYFREKNEHKIDGY